MSNPFVLDAPHDNFAVRAIKGVIRGVKDTAVPESKKWEECRRISKALNNHHVWVWLDKEHGFKLYGQFKTGYVLDDVNDKQVINKIPVDMKKTSVESYAEPRTFFEENTATLRPHNADAHMENGTMDRNMSKKHYDFDILDARVLFSFIAVRCKDGDNTHRHFYDRTDKCWYVVKRIGAEDKHHLAMLINNKKFCSSDDYFMWSSDNKFGGAPVISHKDQRPSKTNDFAGGFVMQVTLNDPSIDKDQRLHVPQNFWTQSKYKELGDSDMLKNITTYDEVRIDGAGRVAHEPCRIDGDWPWDLDQKVSGIADRLFKR